MTPSRPQPGAGTLSAAAGAPRAAPVHSPTPSDPMLARRTEMVLRELDALPTLPAVASRLLQIGSGDEVNIREVVRLIETDPTLTARLLAMCRRAATRTRHPVTTVEMAVVLLGLEAVRSLVLGVQIFDWTTRLQRRAELPSEGTGRGVNSTRPGGVRVEGSGGGEAPARFDRTGFWQHSVAVACCSELIAREYANLGFHPEEAFVCGLLHDLGKLALELVLPKTYARVIELADQRRASMAETERVVIGLDHCVAGAHLAQRWGLPTIICDAVRDHHTPDAGDQSTRHPPLTALVAVADLLCRRLSLGWSGSRADDDLAPLCERAGLNTQRVESVAPSLYEATSSRCKDLGLGDEPSQQLLIDSILRANSRLAALNQDMVKANVDLRQTQDELAEARALARLGQMTAGAAHEMNNPLAVISGRAQALLPRLKDERDKTSAESIVEATERLTRLIARLNRIACPPDPRREPVDLANLLSDTVARAKARNAARMAAAGDTSPVVGVKMFVADGLGAAWIDRELMTDALVEVVVNALEASPRSAVEVRAQADEQDGLCISVVDDGSGMNELALTHALDPFFSHKPAGRQTGLGLALAHRLIRLHEGTIQLTSRPGHGTTATVRLTAWRADRRTGPEASPLPRAAA